MNNRKIYAANTEKVSEVVKDLEIVKSRFDEFMKGMEIKGLGTKYFSNLSLGKQSFSIEIYEKLSRAFNILYQKKKIDKSVKKEDLYIDDEREEKDEKVKTIFLEEYNFCGAYGDLEEKIIFDNFRATKETALLIERFMHAINATLKRQDKFKDKFYSSEEKLQEIKDNAEVNSLIDQLKFLEIFIYGGLLEFPILNYTVENISHIDNYYEIKSFPFPQRYFVLHFSSKKNIEYYKFKYQFLQEMSTLYELEKKFPIKFNYQSPNFGPIKFHDPKDEDHNKILNLLSEEYFKLESNKEFIKIVGESIELPFNFSSPSTKIIPVTKNKTKNEEENEFEE
jgi:hypothetical protein